MNVRSQTLLWMAQRASAAVLVLCVIVHLITIIYAVRNGLSAAGILGRTRGNYGWFVFYAVFVAAIAVHAPIGLRNILSEMLNWRGTALDFFIRVLGIVLAVSGWRAALAVFA